MTATYSNIKLLSKSVNLINCLRNTLYCDNPAGRHLGQGGPTNPPQKEQCRKAVRTVLHTRPGVQRPEAPTTNR